MKKSVLSFVFILFSSLLFSQSWVEVGLKGGFGMDFLINKNITEDTTHTALLSTGYTAGGKLGYNFNEEHGITFDVLYTGFGKSYDYIGYTADSTRGVYNKKFKFNSVDFLLMYRRVKSASYFEIGPQFSTVTKGLYSDTRTSTSNTDVSDNLVKNYFSAVIGAGALLAGTENFRLTFGFRVLYTFDDIVSPNGKLVYFPSGNDYNTYKKSNPLSAMAVLECNFDLGYFTKSSCKKKKTTFLLFGK